MFIVNKCIIADMQITAIDIYKFCDYLPIISVFTNGVVLCAKVVNFFKQPPAIPAPRSFQAYVVEKRVFRCLILILLPGVGNIAFAIYDLFAKTDTPQISQSVVDLPNDAVVKPQEGESSAHLATQTDVPRPITILQVPQTTMNLPSPQTEPSANLAIRVVQHSHFFKGVSPYLTKLELGGMATVSKQAQDMIRSLCAKEQCAYQFPLTFFCIDGTEGIKNYPNLMREKRATLRAFQEKQWTVSEYYRSSLFTDLIKHPQKKAFHVSGSRIACGCYETGLVEVHDTATGISIRHHFYGRWFLGGKDVGLRIAGKFLVLFIQDNDYDDRFDKYGEVQFISLKSSQVEILRRRIYDLACSDQYIAIWTQYKREGNISEEILVLDAQTGKGLYTFYTYMFDGQAVRKLSIVHDRLIAILCPLDSGVWVAAEPERTYIFNLKNGEFIKPISLRTPEGSGKIITGSECEFALLHDSTGWCAPIRFVNLLNGKELARIPTELPSCDGMQLVGNQILFTRPGNPNIMALTPVLPNLA